MEYKVHSNVLYHSRDKNTYFTVLLNYVVGWQSRSFLAGLLQYLAKNNNSLGPKIGGLRP